MTQYRAKSKKIAIMAMFTALAVIMGYVERILPLDIGLQGVKPGLSNIVTLVALYSLGAPYAIIVSVARVFIVSLLFGSFASLMFSLCGALLSFFVMMAAKKMNFFSIPIVSMFGGVFHNIGQLLIAGFLMGNWRVAFYLPVLLASGAVFGIMTGLVAGRIIYFLERMYKQ